MVDMLQLMEYLMERVESHDMEVVLVQVWLIWNQRNRVVHGGKFHDPGWLNNRATEFLEKFRTGSVLMGPSWASFSGHLATPSSFDLQA